MSTDFALIRINPADLELDDPLPYSVFAEDGTLLAICGMRITDPFQMINLIKLGWRQVERIGPHRLHPSSPATKARPVVMHPDVPMVHPVALADTTALVADDMLMARTLLTQILQRAGVKQVIAVEDGQQAVSRFLAHAPNLVLLDIDMPRLDGLEALRQIKGYGPQVFACLVSANSTRFNVELARDYAVDGFVVKPYTNLNITRMLTRYLAAIPSAPSI